MAGPWEKFGESEQDGPWSKFEDVKPEKPRTRGILETANDTVIEVANAAAGGVSSLANMVRPGNQVSSFIDKNIIKAGEEKQSDVVKSAKQTLSQGIQNADGIGGELSAVSKYVVDNPLLAASQAVGSFVVPGAAAKVLGRVGGIGAGAMMAGGDAAGTAYDLSSKAGATDAQALAAGRQASVIPALVGGVTGAFGAEKLLAGGTGFKGGIINRAVKTGLSEAGQEGFEEGVTQYEGQRAAMPYDATIDPTKGVAASAGMGAIMGGATGAGVSLLTGNRDVAKAPPPVEPILPTPTPEFQPVQPSPVPVIQPTPTPPLPSEAMGIDRTAGVLSNAAALAVDTGVHDQTLQTAAEQAAQSKTAKTATKSPEIAPETQSNLIAEQAINTPAITEKAPENTPIYGSAYAQRQATAPKVEPTDILDATGQPFATGFSAKRAAEAAGEGFRPFKIAEKQFVVKEGGLAGLESVGRHAAGSQAISLQNPNNGSSTDSEIVGNLTRSESFIKQGFDGLNPDMSSAVQRHMLRISKDSKVLKSIVNLIPVDVVNNLKRQKITPEMLFHNPSMLQSGSVGGNGDNTVSIPVDAATSIVRIVASSAAKDKSVNELSHSGGLPVNLSTTNNAVVNGASLLGLDPIRSVDPEPRGARLPTKDIGGTGNVGRVSGDGVSAPITIDGKHVITPTSDDLPDAGGASTPSASPILSNTENKSSISTKPIPAGLAKMREGKAAKEAEIAAKQRADHAKAEQTRKDRTSRLTKMTHDKSPFLGFLGKHGINIAEKREFSPDKNPMLSGYGPMFRKNGLPVDQLIQRAVEEGYLPPGTNDDVKLRDLITQQMTGKSIAPMYTEDGAENAMQAEIDRRAQFDEEQALDAINDLSRSEFDDFLDVVEATPSTYTAAELDAMEDIPWDSSPTGVKSSTEAAMKEMGFSKQEIQDAIAEEQRIAQENSERNRQADEAIARAPQGSAGKSESTETGLTAPTREDILAQQDRAAQAEKDKAAADKAAEKAAKEAADKKEIDARQQASAENFQLGQSAEDSLSGQASMFDTPTEQKPPIASESTAKQAIEEVAKKLIIGVSPKVGDAISVKDGVIHIGKYPAQNFETGEDVTVSKNATTADIKKALTEAGAISGKMKFYEVAQDAPVFSRADSIAGRSGQAKSKDQSGAILLNRTMANHFKDDSWSNAYEQVDLPDTLSEYAAAASAAFDAPIVAIRPTDSRFDQFNGINVARRNYVNIDADTSFINIAGHEIYHDIERNRPDLHAWFVEKANEHFKDFDAYKAKLNAVVGENESAYTTKTAKIELLADFTGDALADPVFVAKLAEDNPSKFRALLKHVSDWLRNVASKLSKKDLGSSKYFNDVEAMRKHLNKVLMAYTMKKNIAEFDAPKFSRETNEPTAPNGVGKSALQELSQADDLFALPKSEKKDIQGIISDNSKAVTVSTARTAMGVTHKLTMPDGTIATLTERKPNIYGKSLYGYDLVNGEMVNKVTERPGENPDDVPPTTDLWLDVSKLKTGQNGALAYNIAATYAHNKGMIFIGDPAGLSDAALRRRTEQMISSALKFGTTDHLAPHPRQVKGDAGVPPLKWVYGDSAGNIERMIDVSMKSLENAFPTSKLIAYKDGNFYRTDTNQVFEDRGQLAGTIEESITKRIGLAERAQRTGYSGWRSVARNALFRSLAQSNQRPDFLQLGANDSKVLDGLRDELPRLRAGQAESGTGEAKDRIFYSRSLKDRISDKLNKTETVITGQTSRQYSAEQLAAMKSVGFQVETKSLAERAKTLWHDAGKKMAQGIADQFASVKALDGKAYGLLRLSKGASGAFETFLKGGQLKISDGVYDFDDASKGGVIDQLLTPLQGEHHDFMRWVAANRAERLKGEGKENLFTDADIKALKTLQDGQTGFDYTVKNGIRKGQVTRNRAEIYRDSLVTFNGFNKNILDMAEQSGLIDGDSRKLWEKEFYVPFYRVADEDSGGVRGMNIKGGVMRQQAFKELKGGKNALNADLLDNTLMNWAHLLDASAKNRAAKATIEAAEKMGIASTGNQAVLAQMGASFNNKNGVVWFMDGGQKRYSLIDKEGDGPYLMTALTALEYAGMRNPVMNAMGAFKHALTVGVTASPFFKIRNLIRDSVQVIGTSGIGANPAKNISQGWKLTNPKSDAYFRLLAGGGTIHFGTMMEGSEAKRVQSLVEAGVDSSTILDSDKKVQAFYRKFIAPGVDAYNELGNRGEAVNRAALYEQLRKGGMNHAEASLQARDLMDFSMQGSFTTIRFLSQVVPFFNARIQGMYKLGRSAKENPARFSAVIGAAAVISITLLAAYGDDDDWKKREEWDRNNFWWFKFGGIAFRIPKPFEIGAVATLAERGFELAFDDEMTGKRFGKQVMTLLGDNLSMNPVPQMVKPIMDVYANKNSFNGQPIETMSMERLQPEYRFNGRTSMLARGMSTAANSVTGLVGADAPSPVQIDHMLRGYFGWLGSFAIGTGDLLARPATGQTEQATPDYWKWATGGIASDLRDAPSRYVSQMYTQAKELEQVYGTWKALIKEGKREEAREFFDSNREALSKYKRVEHVKSMESKLNQQIKMIERSDASGDDKRERIRQVQIRKNKLAESLAA